jgi:hypothetical protein
MPDPFRDLVRDTLTFLRDPLVARQSMLATAEEERFFQKNKVTEVVPVAVVSKLPGPPRKEVFSPPPTVPKQEIIPSQPDLSPMKKTLQRIVPSMKMVDQVPNDTQAKRIASAWKEKIFDAEVIFLVCNSDTDTLEFLKGLAKAVDTHLGKTKILMAERLEREKRWDLFFEKNSFRLIIASVGIQQWTELMRFYKAMPTSSQLFLDKIPLFVLSSATLYKSLEHKAHLWKMLCQLLK